MSFLVTIIVAVLNVLLPILLPALAKAGERTAEDGRAQPDLKDRLTRKVMQKWGGVASLLLLAAMLGGCGARTIYVPTGDPVRLRAPVRGAKVWVLDKDGKPTAGTMDLPEGWYCLPDPGS